MKVTEKRIWAVRDPGPDSIMADVMFATSLKELPEYILGTELPRYRFEDHQFYDRYEEAVEDATRRLMKRDGGKPKCPKCGGPLRRCKEPEPCYHCDDDACAWCGLLEPGAE